MRICVLLLLLAVAGCATATPTSEFPLSPPSTDSCVFHAHEYGGRKFFFNSVTNKSTWDAPAGCEEAQVEPFPHPTSTSFITTAIQAGMESGSGVGSSSLKYIEGVHKAWESFPSHAITLTLQADIGRIKSGALNRVANQWNGPISVAILTTSFDDLIQYLSTDANMAVKNWVDVHAVVAAEQWKYYPINKMRNFSIRPARTEFVMVVDIDEDLPYSMDHHLEQLQKANPNSYERAIFVVTSWQWAIDNPPNDMPHGLSELSQLFEKGHATVKHPGYQQAYKPPNLDFWKWKSSTAPREVPYADSYEPYFIVSKSKLPMFDERFEGFGGNKAILTLRLAIEDYRFVLLPRVFTWCRESPSVSELPHAPPNPKLCGEVWWELGHSKGCDQCYHGGCVTYCPWLFNTHLKQPRVSLVASALSPLTSKALKTHPVISNAGVSKQQQQQEQQQQHQQEQQQQQQDIKVATTTADVAATTPTTNSPSDMAAVATVATVATTTEVATTAAATATDVAPAATTATATATDVATTATATATDLASAATTTTTGVAPAPIAPMAATEVATATATSDVATTATATSDVATTATATELSTVAPVTTTPDASATATSTTASVDTATPTTTATTTAAMATTATATEGGSAAAATTDATSQNTPVATTESEPVLAKQQQQQQQPL